MNKIHIPFLVTILFIFNFLGAEEFNLKINDSTSFDGEWPMIASLPFAKGELRDPSAIKIMKGSREVACQVDVATRWQDGSVRWALAGFTDNPQAEYKVEYGKGIVRKGHTNPIKISRAPDGGFSIDTGAAVYRFETDKLMPQEAWLGNGGNRIELLRNSGNGMYLVDQKGRTARVAGQSAEVENSFVKEGPGRVVLKRSGYYVTDSGEKLARAESWFYFAAGTPLIRITHSIIFTRDTNEVWFRDYGMEFKTPEAPRDVYCALGSQDNHRVKRVETNGREVYMLQEDYPHFAERTYKATVGISDKGKDTPVENAETAGDWAHGNYGNHGITIAMPWLAERFPKEISFGPQGARAVLWSGRSGKELDFRAKTIVREYLQSWAEFMLKKPSDKELDDVKSNAQGAARTHDMWFLPVLGGYNEDVIKKTASAASRPPLALADTERLCKTEAMGFPMHHKDVKQFPEEESLLSDFWDRFVIPLYAFPMNGYMAWGCYPDRSYDSGNNKTMSVFQVISSLREYGVRREPWRLYARSGERRYYNWGHKFSRFTGDWYLVHADAPGKARGAFISTNPATGLQGRLPLFWGEKSWTYVIDAGDIGHWLLDYCLTGDERSLDLLHMIKESFAKNNWRPGGTPQQFHATGIRTLVTLMMMDWDENVVKAAKDIVNEMVDLNSQNGFRLFADHYGPMYKNARTSHNILEYYLETGDELAKTAFLKLMDQRYRFDSMRYRAVAYKNYDAFTYSIAYWMTGDVRYRTVAEQAMRDMLYYSRKNPLSKNLEQKSANTLDWPNLYVSTPFGGARANIFLGHYEYHNPFIGMPTVLKLISEKGWSGKTTPLIVKPMEVPGGQILFSHEKGRETRLNSLIKTREPDRKPDVRSYMGNKPVEGIKVEKEKQMPWGPYFQKRPKEFPPTGQTILYVSVSVPAETESGLYLLSFADSDTFTLHDSSSAKAALYCPEGFWSISIGEHTGEKPYGRPGEGMPAFFRVPAGLRDLEIFIGRPASVKAPDGTVVIEASNKNIGRLSIPVNNRHGIWSIEYHINNYRGTSTPVFIKLINVEPVISFGSTKILPESTGNVPQPSVSLPAPKAPLEFVKGVSGMALRLSEGKTLSFPKGEKVARGGYANFPWTTGTVEFWFRADRNTYEVPIEMLQTISTNFVEGPFISLSHKYSGMPNYPLIQCYLTTMLFAKGSSTSPAGFQATHFFREGKWTHIAFTWDVRKGDSGMEGNLDIFVNGTKLGIASRKDAPYPLRDLEGTRVFELADEKNEVSIGPFEGAMDMLRISDTVRYTGDFVPRKTAYIPDSNTRALFNFDGDLRGMSSFAGTPVIMK